MDAGTIRKAGVMGWPVEHSLSPRLHGFWLKKYGITGSYEALAVEPEKLAENFKNLRTRGFAGVNLTIPHKETSLPLMSKLDQTAQRIGAVNTVIVLPDGTLEGRNTDAYGFSQNLLSAGIDGKGKIATLLGAGGAARAVIVALQDMGVSSIRLVNRTADRAERLAKEFGGNIDCYAQSDSAKALADCGLLINSTSLGMKGQPPLDIDLSPLPKTAAVTDLVYVPLETGLLRNARERGHKTVDGLGMLLHQARPAFMAFFGRDPEITDELRSYVLEGR